MSVRSPAENLHLSRATLGEAQTMKLLQLQQKQSPDVQDRDRISYLVFSPLTCAVVDVWDVRGSSDFDDVTHADASAVRGISRLSSTAVLRLPGTESPTDAAMLTAAPSPIYGAGAADVSQSAPPQAAALTAAQSLAAWVYVPPVSDIIGSRDVVFGRGIGIRLLSDGRPCGMIWDSVGRLETCQSGQPAAPGAWHSVIVTAAHPGELRLYVDGSLTGIPQAMEDNMRSSAGHGLTFDARYGIGLAYVWWLAAAITREQAEYYHRGIMYDVDWNEITMYPVHPGIPLTQEPHATVGMCSV